MNTKKFGIIFLASIALLALLGCVSQCSIDTPEKCNKSCSKDADCKWVCSVGCINKDETFDWKGAQIKVCPPAGECTCIDNKCVTCVGEGGTIHRLETFVAIENLLQCCPGLTWILPKDPNIVEISGYCTANCGNGTCDEIESELNCPADCEAEAGAEEQVIGPDAYANEQQAFDAIAEEVEDMPELSDAELEALLGE